MNYVFLAVILLVIFSGIRGWHKGLLRILLSLVSIVIIIVVMGAASPHITNYLKRNTPVYSKIEKQSEIHIKKQIENKSMDQTGIPERLVALIGGKEQSAYTKSEIKTMAQKRASMILTAISFFLAFVAASILLGVIGNVLSLVNHIPILGGINRILGLLAGVLQGILIVSLLFLLLSVTADTETGRMLVEQVHKNSILNLLYEKNLLLEIFKYI